MSSDKTKLTNEIRSFAKKYSSWVNTGADLIGFVSVNKVNEIEPYWVDYNQANTKQPSEILSSAKSVILLGYHAWDDMVEALSRKGNKLEAYGYERMFYNAEKVVTLLENKGFKAKLASGLPMKQIARLAGVGSYGKTR